MRSLVDGIVVMGRRASSLHRFGLGKIVGRKRNRARYKTRTLLRTIAPGAQRFQPAKHRPIPLVEHETDKSKALLQLSWLQTGVNDYLALSSIKVLEF